MKNYYLPENYKHRLNNVYFDDTPYKDEYQDDVYSEAKKVLVDNNYNKVVDIGTGSGFKLIKYFNDNDTLGVDLDPTVVFLKKTYPTKKWGLFNEINDDIDLIICSDVIEHIPEPNSFLVELMKLNFKKIVFSTPDKLCMYGFEHMGEPSNTAHVREWNMLEFNKYLSDWFIIDSHIKSHPNSNTQIVICSKK